MAYTIAALYRFTPIGDAAALRGALKQELARLDLCGTLLVAPEGINGTLAGSATAVDALLDILHCRFSLLREDVKFSESTDKPFHRLKVRLKREIITFRQPDADPSVKAGTYVAAEDWNALIADPEVLLLDTRNQLRNAAGEF